MLLPAGRPLEAFASFHDVPDSPATCATPIGRTGLAVRAVRSRHSETCFGLLVYDHGRAVLGWTADSGYEPGLYEQLALAPMLVVDARAKGSAEHAGEVARRMHTAHAHGAYTRRIHTAHTNGAYTRRIHTAHTHGTYTRHIHTAHTHGTYTRRMHTAGAVLGCAGL
jgi:hypothetical protein